MSGQSPNFVKLRGGLDPVTARLQDNIDATLRPVAGALLNTPIMGAPPPAWIQPTLLNGWGNDRTAANGFALIAYHRDALGYVHCKGTVINNNVGALAGGAVGSAIMQFPAGYRPAESQRFPVLGNGTGIQFILVDMTNAGLTIPVVNVISTGTCDFTFSFLAEQ